MIVTSLLLTALLLKADDRASAVGAAPSPAMKIDRFLGGRMPVGFYIYLYDWKQNKDPDAHDLDDALAEIAKRRFNFLYVGGVADGALWQRVLDLAVKHRLAVVPQLDFAYLTSPSQNAAQLAARAAPFIKKYNAHPAVVAFSVREEPSVEMMPVLKQYYEGILREVPGAPLHLLHDQLPPLERSEPPHPQIIGTDRYPFWWEFGSGGHRATPRYALNWYRTQLDRYQQLVAERGAEFHAVLTANTIEFIMSPESIRKAFYPATVTEEFREQSYRRIEQFAKNKNFGWDQGPPGTLRVWKYYRPPANCVRAMAWLAVLEGARSQGAWCWSPPRDDMQDFAHRAKGGERKEYTCSINGWDGKGTPQLEEYTAFAGEIQRYGRLIRAMSKERAPVDKPPLFATTGDDLFWRSFQLDGYAGRVVVVVNAQVGTWCDGRSPHFLSPGDTYRIDDWGNLIDYAPLDRPREATCRVLAAGMDCTDLAAGAPVALRDDRTLLLSIPPGGGRFLFLSPAGSDEWTRLKRQFGL